MNLEEIKKISELITDESMIQFKDGKTINGATEVTTIIMQCCEEYNKGYLEGRNNVVAAFVGASILGGIIGVGSIILAKKFSKKLNSKCETSKQK